MNEKMDKFITITKTQHPSKNKRYSITFGEVAISHLGSKEIGEGIRDKGYSVVELEKIALQFPETGTLHYLHSELPFIDTDCKAATLVIKNGINIILGEGSSDLLLQEQFGLQYDQKYYDSRRGKTMNKRSRMNTVFGPTSICHSEDYKQYTVVGFNELPHLDIMREKLSEVFGIKAKNLNAEGNLYFESKSGIGFHGDAERKIVICLSLGASSTLRYRWRAAQSVENTLDPIDLVLEHGDIYIMSEKATGYDWHNFGKWRLVHAAGHSKYIGK